MVKSHWHAEKIETITKNFDTDLTNGLKESQVRLKQQEYGLNKLPDPPRKSGWKILLNQFNDILIYILIVAAIVTLILAFVNNPDEFSIEYFFDTIVIVVVLIINAAIGYYQEIKAEKAVQSLQSLVSENATVYRDGSLKIINAVELVPGDIVEFNPGERLAADIRLFDTKNLKINESALTGESLAVSKNGTKVFDDETTLGDRRNMAFMGTIVETGKGKGIVIATGKDTEVGKISTLVSNIGTIETPLQRKLEEFSSFLAKAIIVISIFLIVFGGLVEFIHAESREDLPETILGLTVVGVSLAVAAIPEGLPIILTFTLAISVQKMASQNAIIRNLEAVETLGSTTFIASDKTGTLTQNRLSLMQQSSLTSLTNLNDQESLDGKKITQVKLLEIMKYTTSSLQKLDRTNPDITTKIDPLDLAILEKVEAYRDQVDLDEKSIEYEYPFDSDRKMMSVIVKSDQNLELVLKGAPDVVLSHSTHYLSDDGKVKELTNSLETTLFNKLEELAQSGYRVIGCAYRGITEENFQPQESEARDVENNLIFTGFLSFIDPPRPEVYDALKTCYNAGIRVAMITGDHPQTALTIAKDLGITDAETGKVLVGRDLDKMNDQELTQELKHTTVFARVTAAHKLRLISLLKDQGEIVGMTGDGVNDSPALVKADIGVAMGIAGTDAAKESSDMILLDDNFATLVNAVEEGRVVNSNIKKFTNYLLASNTSEVGLLLFGFFLIAAFQPLLIRELIPLSETQILYLNLVTDSFLALALGLERREKNLMSQDPLAPDTPIVTRKSAIRIGIIGISVALMSVVIFLILLGPSSGWTQLTHAEIAYAQSFTLTFLVLSEVFIAISYRSSEPVHRIGYFSNRFFIISVFTVVIAQIAILYIPILNALFDTQPLSLVDWLIIIILSILVFIGLELSKVKIGSQTRMNENKASAAGN